MDANKKFDELRIEAANLLFQAACLPGVANKMAWQHVKAMARMVAMDIKPMRGDFQQVGNDLRELARHMDDLIEAIGFEAAIHDHNIEQAHFKGVVTGNLSWAFEELDDAASRAEPDPEDEETRRATLAEMKREFWKGQ